MARGGARPGAGRKPKAQAVELLPVATAAKAVKATSKERRPVVEQATPAPADDSGLSPLDYLLSVVRDVGADERVRIQAASIAAPYIHARKAEATGKKVDAAERAKAAAGGKFASAAPPKLVAAGGRKV